MGQRAVEAFLSVPIGSGARELGTLRGNSLLPGCRGWREATGRPIPRGHDLSGSSVKSHSFTELGWLIGKSVTIPGVV